METRTFRELTARDDGWPALYRYVLTRDGICVFAGQTLVRGGPVWTAPHDCEDRNRKPIDYRRGILALADAGAVELDHVKEEPKAGEKAPHDSMHLVVACWSAHHEGLATSRDGRAHERRWLATLYPDTWATFIERGGLLP